jgi:hypothetical protein
MQISGSLFVAKWKTIIAAMVVLVAGKLAVMMAAGQMFGLSRLASLRAGECCACRSSLGLRAWGVMWCSVCRRFSCAVQSLDV